MNTKESQSTTLPFTSEVNHQLEQITKELSVNQLNWLGGYFTGLANATGSIKNSEITGETPNQSKPEITLLFGTKTGNAHKIMNRAKSQFEQQGHRVNLLELAEVNKVKLLKWHYVFIAVSTDGEGVPPPAVEEFYDFIHSKKAPNLQHIQFSVLGLGDSSYANFCQTGKDIDLAFEKLGAKRIVNRADADLDFEDLAQEWTNQLVESVGKLSGNSDSVQNSAIATTQNTTFSHKNPYVAEVIQRIKLNGKGSKKEVYHVELSIEDSGITYQPGDSLGIIPKNPEPLVQQLISSLNIDGNSIYKNGYTDTVKNHLVKHYEISRLSKYFLEKYNEKAKNKDLKKIINNQELLSELLATNDLFDIVKRFPTKIDASELLPILPKLKPRLYSISSSPNAHPGEVHITVGALKYNTPERLKEGICSNMIADRITLDDTIEVYVDENTVFRLPENDNTPIIMIGPGTGIAPFRAFVEERAQREAKGKNWVFFGEQHFRTDFLYQTEWLNYLKKEIISRFDVAFSRDQKEKIYVQHKIEQHATEFYEWLQAGAIVYVCGDKDKMATDVLKSITKVLAIAGKLSDADAKAYVKKLRKEKRYLEDIY